MSEIICGRQAVYETLKAGKRKPYRIFLSQRAKPAPIIEEVTRLGRKLGIQIEQADQQKLFQFAGSPDHQGLALEASEYPYVEFSDLLESLPGRAEAPLILVLDHIQDPQNMGSVLRTAECAGVHAVIIPTRGAAGVTPAVVRVSAGATEHVDMVAVNNLHNAVRELKENGITVVGLENAPGARSYTETDWTGPLALVVGSEGEGLGRLMRELCDALVKLPLYGKILSLNAGVAAAIALYEIRRQRGQHS